MLIGRDNHYYVRKGGMEQDYEIAFGKALDQASKDFANAIWPNGVSTVDQDQTEGRDDDNEAEGGDEVIIVGKQRRGKSKPIKEPRTAGPGTEALDGKTVPCQTENQDFKDLAESGETLEIVDGKKLEKKLGKLKIIFWNSNGWDTDRCDRIANLAKEEDADVVCIQDSRMDQHREQHLKGYMKKRQGRNGEERWCADQEGGEGAW